MAARTERYDEPRTESEVGSLLRLWRERRRLSQLALAQLADVSTRHLSFLETGRSRPSREMLAHLAEQLQVPLRERNQMLLAAGYAPAFPQTGLDEPAMLAVRSAVRKVLASHDPYPAVVVDGNWDVVEANLSFTVFTEDVAPELLVPPVNVLRLALHPQGTAPRILNLAEWRAHLLDRLRARIAVQPWLADLHQELSGYPYEQPARPPVPQEQRDVCVPLRIRAGGKKLAFFAVLTSFGAPRDVTVDELVIESFYPADARTIAARGDR